MPPRPERSGSRSHSAGLEEEESGARKDNYTWTAWVKTTAVETEAGRLGPRLAATSRPSQPGQADTTRRPEESLAERSETAEGPGMITDDVDDNDDDKVPGKFEYSPVFQVPPKFDLSK